MPKSKVNEIENKKHSRLSCSGAKRFMTCPGSIAACEQHNPTGKRTSTKFAAEGTVAHELCDICLEKSAPAKHFLGQKFSADGFTFTVNNEMVDAVQDYLDYVYKQANGIESDVQSEVWGSLELLDIPGLDGGTTDALIISPDEKTIVVIDFKYGQGVAVEVEENPQLMCYGLAPLLKLVNDENNDMKGWEIKLVIVQPRAFHPDGPIREWTTDGYDLLDWGLNKLKPAAQLAITENAPLKASDDGCKFCEAAGNCPELANKTQELAIIDFEDMDVQADEKFPSLPTLTPQQKINIMEHATAIKSFIVAVENQIKIDMENGDTGYADHFKLVRKQTRRKLTDEALDPDFSPFLDVLDEDQVFIRKTETLGNLEKALKANLGTKQAIEFLKNLVIKPEGDVVVAKLSDKRKAIEPSAKRDFEGLEDD